MSKVDIWMPIYIGDYLRDTAELSAEEHGAYFLLLMHYWQKNGEIGADVDRLARVARTQPETARFILGSYFVLENGNYKNKRADEEIKNADTRRETARENGMKGGRPPKNNPEETGGLPGANLAPNPQESSSPSSSSSHSSLPSTPSSGRKEGPSRLETLRKYWNESGAGPECRLLSIQFRPEDSSDCLRTMSVYTDEEIEEAITIYAGIVKDPEYDPPRYGGFVGFMRGGVEKFVASANPAEAFKIRKKFESAGEREERERAEAIARLEAL